tara:strand:+ start:10653 stop:12446 length:1794 start_codon:yes stop_codon:yes gene_type:complete
MPDNQKKIIPINYTNREFDTIKKDLLEIAERLYPDSFQDFSEASFAALMMDAVAYVGDQLSFYLDYNVNESFLDTAYQFNNILRHGRVLGYKFTGRPSTYGVAAFYVSVPSSAAGLGINRAYAPILKKGSEFKSSTGLIYTLTESINFADNKHPVVVARTNADGAPTHYAIKAYGRVVSGQMITQTINVGPFEKFARVRLPTANVSEVISVFDLEGNEYFEVDYLAQDMVYKEISNTNYKNDNVPSILKPFMVARKFTVERDNNGVFLQFGSGKENANNIVSEPQSVAMDVFGKTYTNVKTFDPTRLSENEAFGIVPENTTLIIAMRVTNPGNSNLASRQLNQVSKILLDFEDKTVLSTALIQDVRNSIEVENETPITGDVTNPNSDEIKQRIYDTFPTQNRAVTQADYENLAYRMHSKFGSIKRVSVQKDFDSQKRNLNMYVVSDNSFGKLVKTNSTIKRNLKIWLNQYRMINDTIDILDPFIINLGIEFSIKAVPGADKKVVLSRCVEALSQNFGSNYYIGESVVISDIYRVLNNVVGVLDVIKARVFNKTGANYSGATLNINKNLSPDGNRLIIPKNAIAEFKFKNTDFVGKAK